MSAITGLRQIEYKSADTKQPLRSTAIKPGNLPLMQVQIDFDKKTLQAVGDWQYLLQISRNKLPNCIKMKRARVDFNLSISSSPTTDEQEPGKSIFLLKGNIADEWGKTACTGILMVAKNNHYPATSANWIVSCWLNESLQQGCDIKFKLLVQDNMVSIANN
jgi:hypothetical protein